MTRWINLSRVCVLAATAMLLAGCANSQKSGGAYETVADAPNRDTEMARAENHLALKLLSEGKYPEAEAALKSALTADVTFGPAHNNLGKVYYHQKKFYLAAWEFQYAIKAMPHQPEPRNNLGMVMEMVGKLDEAVEIYGEAVDMEPDNPQILGNLVRARVRRGDHDQETQKLLSELIMRDTRPEWVAWAKEKLVMMTSVHHKDVP
ncbi:MAG: tetratricopeptide repeat protein [Planctomycetes bacterium]|nr:tetratricopeptide repeat protein [Planctomycetota bacterium]